jgi:LPS-assembly lipoprotein
MRHPLQTALVIGALALGLGGCLRPLYGSAEYNGLNIQRALAGVRVTVQGDRLQHYLRNELEFGLRGGNPVPGALPGKAADTVMPYSLVVHAGQRVNSAVVDRLSGVAESATMVLEATYTLTETGKSGTLETGTATVIISYDRSQQRFASVRAARDAEIQGAKQMAEQIKTRVAAYLASKR